MTNEKIITLTIQTFVDKVMSVLFNILSSFIVAFFPRSKHLLISSCNQSAVILESKKIKSVTASTFPPSICHEVMELDSFLNVEF